MCAKTPTARGVKFSRIAREIHASLRGVDVPASANQMAIAQKCRGDATLEHLAFEFPSDLTSML
jgi:hypothetical protein